MKRIAVRRLAPFLTITFGIVITASGVAAPKKSAKDSSNEATPVLWQDPVDIAGRDLVTGPGGADHQPKAPFRFLKEDAKGTNPKYVIEDGAGVKWKLKLGEEAHPETAASRIVWAVGYYADTEYFVPDIKVDNVPSNLKRGEKLVEPDGLMHNARLKRYSKGEEKSGTWSWKANPFTGTREFNGLRVIMALINNWDLKDENNATFDSDGKKFYYISDLGASFGTTGRSVTRAASKGNLENFTSSRFIVNTTDAVVNFGVPSRPALIHILEAPEFKQRVDMEWIGRNIPLADARWIGAILAKLSPEQIQSAFGAAGYSPKEVVGFSAVIEDRIAQLNRL
ncbi:MAG: hypothetical protein M3N93_15050 [Acidobacteriota bacterium]|nr:hypothetical protein [Acidobacteriota bacterium]